MYVFDVIVIMVPLPKHVLTLPTDQLPAVLIQVSLKVLLSQKIFFALLALEVPGLLMDEFHVSLDVILPGEPVPTQLTPELLEPEVRPEVRPVRLLLELLLTLGALHKHHVSLSQQLGKRWNAEGVCEERVNVSLLLAAS